MDVENRQTHKQAVQEGFWFSFMLMHYSLQAVPQKVFLKAVEKRWREEKKQKRFPFVLFKTQTPTLKFPMCKLGLKTHCVSTACVNGI